jgi:hypothetical protein
MLNITFNKRAHTLALIVVVSVVVTATTALAKGRPSSPTSTEETDMSISESSSTKKKSVSTSESLSYSSTELIKAAEGGTIYVDPGVQVVIPPGALEEDTVISVSLVFSKDKIEFGFHPSPLSFLIPVDLMLFWHAVGPLGLEDFIIYGEGETVEPEVYEWGALYKIPHFSLYYYRRR